MKGVILSVLIHAFKHTMHTCRQTCLAIHIGILLLQDWIDKVVDVQSVCNRRLLEVISYKIFNVQKEDVILDCLNSAGTKTYRIEEIPKDEIDLSPDEILVPVAHFQKVTT